MNELAASPPADIKPSYSRRRLMLFIALALAIHVALIFIFGTKKAVRVRPVKNIPHLQIADNSSEMVALENPALFALPGPMDFAAQVWQKIPSLLPPSFRWTEPPRYLAAPQNLGELFRQFMQTNQFTKLNISPRLLPQVTAPVFDPDFALPKKTTLQIAGALAQRKLLRSPETPSLPLNEIIPPSRVQALVNAAGDVVSVVLLPDPDANATAGQMALVLARTAKFSSAEKVTLGEMIFNWHTVPTNNMPASP